MSAPFDTLAPAYHELWTQTPMGRAQREQVWAVIDPLFPPGSHVLDLGCGTGDDAVHLMERGVAVDAIDASQEMVAIARSRGVPATVAPVESIAVSEPRPLGSGGGLSARPSYSSALSNFGALNCVASLAPIASALADVLPAGAPAALCVMGRFSLRETAGYVFKLDLARAVRRWRGHAIWRGIPIRYWSASEVRSAFRPHFRIERRVSIGGGDHQLYILRRTPC